MLGAMGWRRVLCATLAIAGCDRTTTSTSPSASTATATATATGIVVPAGKFDASIEAGLGPSVPSSAAPGMLTQCRPIHSVRGLGDGPDVDAHGCPSKLKSDGT
jgi:hypothetical protein